MKRTPAELEQMQRIRDVRACIAANAFCKPVAPPPTPAPAIITPVRKPVREQTRAQRLARCVRLISHIYGVPREEIRRGKDRKRKSVDARAAYTWMLWLLTDWGLTKIARHQECHHTTTLHSLRRVSEERPHRRSYRERRAPGDMKASLWTAEEVATMKSLFMAGYSDEQISAAMNRSIRGLVCIRLRYRLYRQGPHSPALAGSGKVIVIPNVGVAA